MKGNYAEKLWLIKCNVSNTVTVMYSYYFPRDNFKRQICTRTNKLHEFVSDGSIEEEYIHGNWIDTGMTISSPLSSHDILTVPKTYAQCTATVGPWNTYEILRQYFPFDDKSGCIKDS